MAHYVLIINVSVSVRARAWLRFKHFERWASASDFPVENIVNDGTTTHTNRLGAVADFDLVLRTKSVNDDVMLVGI